MNAEGRSTARTSRAGSNQSGDRELTDRELTDRQPEPQSGAGDADREAARSLLEVSRVLMGVTLRAVAAAPVPLTVPQHRVLITVAEEGSRRVGALAEDLGVNQSNASRIVDRLVGQGLVRRTRDQADGRASLVALTAEGQHVLEAVQAHRLEALLQVVQSMPGDSRGLAVALAQLSPRADAHRSDLGDASSPTG
ncbi:MAG TPA: MarR family transcriptional regulator [Sporichthya sp.]|nr:MarR family transcriptional regulator [Sporichthya sp.]